jgi:hypothetical protein
MNSATHVLSEKSSLSAVLQQAAPPQRRRSRARILGRLLLHLHLLLLGKRVVALIRRLLRLRL